MAYYDWLYYKGDEKERPARPGPHPDKEHEWNTHPEKFANVDDIDVSSDSSEYFRSAKHASYIETKSDFHKSKIFFDMWIWTTPSCI